MFLANTLRIKYALNLSRPFSQQKLSGKRNIPRVNNLNVTFTWPVLDG